MSDNKKFSLEIVNLLESILDGSSEESIIDKKNVLKIVSDFLDSRNEESIDFYIPNLINSSSQEFHRTISKLCLKKNKIFILRGSHIINVKNLLKKFFIFRFLYSNLFQIYKIIKNFSFKKYSIISYSEYKFLFNVKDEILIAGTTINFGEVDFFDENTIKKIDYVRFKNIHPQVSIFEIDHCIVNGGTNIYFANNFAVVHDNFDIDNDWTSEELHNRISINVETKKLKLINNSYIPADIDVAAPFLDALSINYAHWTTEVLPRIALFCKEKKYENIPIIINEGLHKNILQSLFTVIGPTRPIYELPIGTSLKLKKCIGISVLGYIPFEPRDKSFQNLNHGIFHPAALCNLVKSVELNTSRIEIIGLKKRLYLTRSSNVRKLLNEKLLIKYLSEKGFVPVNLSDLSFVQQLILFKNAEYIISPTGAGLANCIYCDSNVKIGILLANHKDMIYGYWQAILSPLNKKISYVSGSVEQKKHLGIHADFTIPLSSLEKMIKFWGIS
jgi:capsular polysaccharide biosynthesis protein